ncbi:MAG TPA: caspase family protein, partial [Ardenticatenaceae bacterium]
MALIVGVDQYQAGVPSLQNAVRDAAKFAEVLENISANTDLSYDSIRLIPNCTRDELLQAFKEIRDAAPEQLLFYFAGHGVARFRENKGVTGYLLLADATATNSASWLAMQTLYDLLDSLTCSHVLTILDCCFAGTFRWAKRDAVVIDEGEPLYQERFERYLRDNAWQVIASSAADELALDSNNSMLVFNQATRTQMTEDEHSPFAHALFAALEGEADLVPRGGDGVITASELYVYLEHAVRDLAENQGHRQSPQM